MGNALADVPAVGQQRHFGRLFERFQAADDREKLQSFALRGGFGIAGNELLITIRRSQDKPPLVLIGFGCGFRHQEKMGSADTHQETQSAAILGSADRFGKPLPPGRSWLASFDRKVRNWTELPERSLQPVVRPRFPFLSG